MYQAESQEPEFTIAAPARSNVLESLGPDLASVMTIDVQSAKIENMSKAPGTCNEVEGIFPDGQYTLVEADRQVEKLGGERGSRNIDIWRLKLDGTGKDFQHLTRQSVEPRCLDGRSFHGVPARETGR
jgi:hypothetical protein